MSKRVVIVEDYEPIADVESTILSLAGFDVIIASTGEEALKIIENRTPNVVILDLMLSGKLSGVGVLDAIRKDGKQTPAVIVISALIGGKQQPDFSQYENVHIMSKPFKVREITELVKKLT
jgi:DNA-binding response OmpR family regulator